MFRWMKNRKEKKERRRQDKHRRMLNAMKSTDRSSTDCGFYKNYLMFNCVAEIKSHYNEETYDMSSFPPQFTRIVGSDFKFDTKQGLAEQPQQLPARIFSRMTRSLSVNECREVSNEERFRKTVSFPSFHSSKLNFHVTSDADEEPLYNEPWDCKNNFIVQHHDDKIHLRFYEKRQKQPAVEINEFDSIRRRIFPEDDIYFEPKDSDAESFSRTGSDCCVFTDESRVDSNVQELINTSHSSHFETNELSDSDASSGFCEGHSESDDEHKIQLLKSFGNSVNNISSASLFRFNTSPRSRRSKIYEDSEIYLIPRRRCNSKENKTGFETNVISRTGSDYSVFKEETKDATNVRGHKTTLQSYNCDAEEEVDSDVSSGFCDGQADVDEIHKIQLLKSLSNPESTTSSISLIRFNMYPKSRCSKIYEDSEFYFIPNRCRNMKENNTGNQMY